MAQRLLPGVGVIDETSTNQRLLPGVGVIDEGATIFIPPIAHPPGRMAMLVDPDEVLLTVVPSSFKIDVPAGGQ